MLFLKIRTNLSRVTTFRPILEQAAPTILSTNPKNSLHIRNKKKPDTLVLDKPSAKKVPVPKTRTSHSVGNSSLIHASEKVNID